MSQFYKSGDTQSYDDDKDLKANSRRQGSLKACWPDARDDVSDKCPECGYYGPLDAFGFCRTDECRRNRLVAALNKGEAMMVLSPDPENPGRKQSVLVWTPGRNIRAVDEKGK